MLDSKLLHTQPHPRELEPPPPSHLIWAYYFAVIIHLSFELFKEFSNLDPHPWLRGVYTCIPSALPLGSGQIFKAIAPLSSFLRTNSLL